MDYRRAKAGAVNRDVLSTNSEAIHVYSSMMDAESHLPITPEQIWHLLQTADNFLKFGADERSIERARARYNEALAAAEEAGLEGLVEQAKIRLKDLEDQSEG